MPRVEESIELEGVGRDDAWAAIEDFEAYPATMEDVLEVRFLERSESAGVSDWRVLLNGSELTWTERDRFERPARIDFEQIDGDLEVFRGHWRLDETPAGVRVELVVEFDVGIPSLAPVLDPMGVQAIRSNSRRMLAAIARRTPARGGGEP